MKKLLLCCILLCSSQLFAQKFGLSVKGGALFSIVDQNMFDASVDGQTFFSLEVTGGYFFNKNLSVNVGFANQNYGYKTHDLFYSPSPEIPSDFGRIDVKYSYLAIPVFASYSYYFTRFYIGADLGMSFNINTSATLDAIAETDIDDANSFVPAILVGIKAGYTITDRLSFDLSCRYNGLLTDALDSERIILGTNEHGAPLYYTIPEDKFNGISALLGINYKF